MTRLYVIGNGFDLHHRIPSSYERFRQFVQREDPETYETAETFLFSDEALWADFENNLAYLDTDAIIDEAEQHLVSYGAEDWSDAYHHAYPEAIDEIVSALSGGLHDLFVRWLGTLALPANTQPSVNIDPSALFLTFNYTSTLQRLYGVPERHVLHIHGKLDGPASEIILGHGWQAPAARRPRPSNPDDPDDYDDRDTRVIDGERHITDYFRRTFKPTTEILERNKALFAQLGQVDQVWVIGHSVSDVDMPYFEAVRRQVSPTARWTVSYYDADARAALQEQVNLLGLPPDRVQFRKIEQFWLP